MDFCTDKPHVNESAERLAAIEKNWSTWYDGENNAEFEIHESPWISKCIDKATGGKSNLRWFVPLCEKTPAMKWLADQGHVVIGVELVGKAIETFFNYHGIKFSKCDVPELKFGCLYQSEDQRIKIFKCNIFDVTRDLIGGPVDAIWDRGSMQDIDHTERPRYGDILLSVLKPDGRILAETFETVEEGAIHTRPGGRDDEDDHQHDQEHGEHRPHSVNAADFDRLYGERCNVEVLAEEHWGENCQVVDKSQPYSHINTVRLITWK